MPLTKGCVPKENAEQIKKSHREIKRLWGSSLLSLLELVKEPETARHHHLVGIVLCGGGCRMRCTLLGLRIQDVLNYSSDLNQTNMKKCGRNLITMVEQRYDCGVVKDRVFVTIA